MGKGENFPSAAFFYVETIAYQLNVNGTVKTGKQIAWEYQGGSNFARHAFNGVWSAWIPYVTTNDITSDFTASVIQDLNSPTMAINSYLNNASNPPNGYQTGGKVVSVIDSNGELGAQLSLTRGYSHPQYRYKDNNGWSAWNNILLESDQKTIQVGSDHAVTDCNNVMPGQIAYVYANAAHAPSGNKSWNVWCTGLDAFRMQIAINVTTNVPIMMIRSSHTGVWSDWVEK